MIDQESANVVVTGIGSKKIVYEIKKFLLSTVSYEKVGNINFHNHQNSKWSEKIDSNKVVLGVQSRKLKI